MRPRGKGKGSQFERDFSRRLSLWFSDGDKDDLFWRTPNSGGLATVRHRKGKANTTNEGDIQAVADPRAIRFMKSFVIELKRGYSYGLLDGILKPTNRSSLLFDFCRQLQQERESSGRPYGMLVLKRDRQNAVVILEFDPFFPEVFRDGYFHSGLHFAILGGLPGFKRAMILSLEQFFTLCDPSKLMQVAERSWLPSPRHKGIITHHESKTRQQSKTAKAKDPTGK